MQVNPPPPPNFLHNPLPCPHLTMQTGGNNHVLIGFYRFLSVSIGFYRFFINPIAYRENAPQTRRPRTRPA